MMAYSMDVRQRAVDAVTEHGMTRVKAAEVFDVATRTLRRWITRAEEGRLSPNRSGPTRPRKAGGRVILRLWTMVQERPGITSDEASEALDGLLSPGDIRKKWCAMGLSFKKKSVHAAERDRPDVANSRAAWRSMQGLIDPERLVFLDESCVKTDMQTLRGRALEHERCVDSAPAGHWSTTTLLTAIRGEGVIEQATVMCPGAMTGDVFESYSESMLAPALRPGDIVVMDNLSCHKRAEAKAAIEAAGASVWFLPPYSPDLNPIELAFSKVKQALRRWAARSLEQLDEAVVAALRSVTMADIRGWMREAGYAA